MRNPLSALEAFSLDAQAVSASARDGDASLGGWLAVTKAAERLSALPLAERAMYLAAVSAAVLPPLDARPTLVHDDLAPPTDAVARLAERLRVEAEQMERAGCFEMAFATVAAVCRLTTDSDQITRMLAIAHLGRIARQLGDVRTAHDCYASVVNEAMRERDGPLQALGLLGLGGLARMRGNRPEERRLYGKALECAKPGGIAERSAHQGLMNAAISERRLADALIHGWRVYDLAPDGSEVRAMVLSNLALTALEADFLEAALQGFQHVLTLTDIIRIRLPAFGGAVRAAARLGDRDRLSNLEDAAISEAERANTPFEVASFYLSASEAWLAVPDRRMADRRLQRVNALVQEHQFHELSMRADALRARLQMATAPAGGRQQSVWPSATAGAWDEETVINGIHRLTCLPT